jgi:hypothetical protein
MTVANGSFGNAGSGVTVSRRGIRGEQFTRTLPIPAWLIDHAWVSSLILLAIGGVVSVVWSPHIGIAFTAFAYFLFCFRIERRHLDQLILPPLVLIGFQHVLSSGLGLPMFWYGIEHRYGGSGLINLPILETQVCHALGLPALMFGYWLAQRKAPAFTLPMIRPRTPERLYRLLCMIGWFFLVYYAIYLLVGFATGGTDRSRYEQEFLEQRGFTVWSIFNIFPRLQLMYFVLLPLMYKLARIPGRIILIAFNSFLFFTFFISGSRGMLLTPICLVLAGWWSFGHVSRRVISFLMVMALLTLLYVPLIALYRSTDAFANARQQDWWGRLAAFADVRKELRNWDLMGLVQLTGQSFYGVSDDLIFTRTPSEIPHSGWDNIGRLKYFWLPSQFAPDKKPLLDGNEIVSTYMDNRQIFGSGISFSADMYRRFGWGGILAGNLCLGLFLGRFARWVFRLQIRHKELWTVLLLVYFMSYFTSTPFHSLLGTAWIWLWEFPKHLVVLYVLVLIAEDIDRTPWISSRSRPAHPKMVMPVA